MFFFEKDAVFSPDRLYRYTLTRRWDDTKPIVNWLMLNPSTADENVEDPTIRKCMKFATLWEYGGVVITNLFAYRATDPDQMKAYAEPVGKDNDHHISEVAKASDMIVCAWGNDGAHQTLVEEFNYARAPYRGMCPRSKYVIDMLLNTVGIPLYCMAVNKTGEPQHPLYLPFKQKPSVYYGYGTQSPAPGNIGSDAEI
jgi:hypothetical protein